MTREEFYNQAVISAMNALMIYNPNTSKLYIAKEAVKMAEILSNEVYGEEIEWPKERLF
jgi:hypothetical protein